MCLTSSTEIRKNETKVTESENDRCFNDLCEQKISAIALTNEGQRSNVNNDIPICIVCGKYHWGVAVAYPELIQTWTGRTLA